MGSLISPIISIVTELALLADEKQTVRGSNFSASSN